MMTAHLRRISRVVVNGLFWLCMTMVIVICLQVFIFSSFRIPSDSMEPELVTGDNIVVNKLVYGARLFNVFESLEGKEVRIYRLPGFRKVQRNDVIVFNFPHPFSWERIQMNLTKY